MSIQSNDHALPHFASISVASLPGTPGGVAGDSQATESGKAGAVSGAGGTGVGAPQEACDLLMIGDSLIDTLHGFGGKYAPLEAVWDRHYAPRHAINLGHSGIRAEGTLANLEGGEMGSHTPKVAVLLIGTNDTDERANPPAHTPEQICATTQAIVASILRQSPATKVLILRIFPKGGDDEPGVGEAIFHSSLEAIEIARRAGELTAGLADGKQVFWLDSNQVFLRPDGKINTDLMPDLVHPNQAGAEAWAQAIEPTLAQLMGDQPIVDPPANQAMKSGATRSRPGCRDPRPLSPSPVLLPISRH